MPKKTTTNLENELKRCETLEDFLNVNKMELATTSLAQQIQAFIESKGLTRSDVVKACNLNEVYASFRCPQTFQRQAFVPMLCDACYP